MSSPQQPSRSSVSAGVGEGVPKRGKALLSTIGRLTQCARHRVQHVEQGSGGKGRREGGGGPVIVGE